MNLQKRLAAKMLGCSPQRICVDPSVLAQAKEAITRADVRSLLKKGVITRKPIQGIAHGRFRLRIAAHKKGRRQRAGSRKGGKYARTPRKEKWMSLIRAQRALLKRLHVRNHVPTAVYRELYTKAKGGFFRSTRHLKLYIEEQGFMKK